MKRRYRATGPDEDTRLLVWDRDHGQCVRCGSALRWATWPCHHRRPRALGGSSRPDTNSPANLLALCPSCHAHIESHRAEALTNGWLVLQLTDPASVAVLVEDGARAVFGCTGGLDGHSEDRPARHQPKLCVVPEAPH